MTLGLMRLDKRGDKSDLLKPLRCWMEITVSVIIRSCDVHV